ncbi:MAG: hypothetical protein JNM36_13615 [Chitinophagales bacterium]|jgi:hypothetical protein|nr:hypothetical protein [Chitinophagales bacterium]
MMTLINKLHLYIFIACLVCGVSFAAAAQTGGSNQDLESLRIAFITKELHLNTSESQKFWPIYNEYLKELKQLKNADEGADLEEAKVALRKKYADKFKAAGMAETKISELPKAEKEFKKFLLDKLH